MDMEIKGVMETKMKIIKTILLLLFLFVFIILSSCNLQSLESGIHSQSKVDAVQNQKKIPALSFLTESDYLLPIPTPNGERVKVFGWLNNDEILYSANLSEDSKLYLYNLNNGESKLIFESIYPIISTIISHDRRRVLIHSSKSSFEGLVTIISTDGVEEYSGSFPSVEMVFEWNQYDSDQLLITAFKEDWTFTNYLLKLQNKEINTINIRKPFAKWTGKETLAYLDWNEDDISIMSPLVQTDFSNNERLLKDGIFQFDSFRQNKLTITADTNVNKAHYTFYLDNMREKSTFIAPLLTSYSGWLIPDYEMSSDEEEFFAIIPLESAEADTYNSGFQFISYHLESKEVKILLENIENVPFSCSPNKEYCLMGYELEKLLYIEDKTIITVINK
jgi:hypothetical protein